MYVSRFSIKKSCLTLLVDCCLMLSPCVQAQVQVAPDRYRIDFVDKNYNRYTTDEPHLFLSERALLRRARQGIAVVQTDLPVSACYIDSLKRMGFEVLNTSRWFNSATVRCSPDDFGKLQTVNFIKHIADIRKETSADTVIGKEPDLELLFSFLFRKKNAENDSPLYAAPVAFYGQAADQTGMMNGQALHNRGFRGKGMLIAVIDGGFYKVNRLSGFDNLRNDDRLREVRNFTVETESVWGENNHGTNVFSIIACDLPGRMMGSAPDAEYVLLRSEEIGAEYAVEEDNWVAAVEYADSIGVDVITSSLGYSVFDDASQNYCFDDLDGRTSRASLAASMAAARGMIVCVSAGNDGETNWKRISVPADADSIMTVGAVDRNGQYTSFSSVGYTADKRIKPDLMAMGQETAYQNSTGNINTGNGTSYSTPLLAGFVACLWQAFPDRGNMEILEMLKRSASHYHEPDSIYGYGVPDFAKLMETATLPSAAQNDSYILSVLPDTGADGFALFLSPARHGRISIRIRTVSGQQVFSHTDYLSGYDAYRLPVVWDANFTAGVYVAEARTDAGITTAILIR